MTELGIGIVAARARARRLGTSLILLFLLYRLLLHGRRLLALLLLLVFAHEEGTTKRSGQRPWREINDKVVHVPIEFDFIVGVSMKYLLHEHDTDEQGLI